MTELVISSSVLILVLALLRHFFKGKISPGIQYALWALVLVRLLVPVSPLESPVSIMNAFNTATVVNEERALVSAPLPLLAPSLISEETETVLLSDDASQAGAAGAANAHHGTSDWVKLLRFIWYAGIAIVGLCLILSNLIFGRRLVKAREKYQADNFKLPVYVAEGLPTSCLFGVFHPAIYITPDLAEDETKLRYVLAHEQTHYRHGDHIWSALRSLCLALHWYNPLVWLAAVLSRRDAELACDESTIKEVGEANRMEYGRTLIGLTSEKRKTTDLLYCATTATTMIDGKSGIKERIMFIAKKPKTLVPAFVAVLLAVLIAVGCTFTGAKNDKPELLERAAGGTNNTDGIGLVMDSISVPPEVLSAAKAQVAGYFASASADHPDYEYANWRIESLEWAYTYDNLDGLALDIYCMNYEFFSKAPEKISLAGGMYVTDDGWVCPTYPHSTYLIFNADDGFFFRAIMRNDCYPGDETFTSDLSNLRLSEAALKAAGVGEAIASVDIDRDGSNEKFYLDTSRMTEKGPERVTLRIYNDRGYGIWSENACLAHTGWNSLFLCELDGEPYLLRYNPAMFQGYCDYTYTLFTLEGGAEKVYQTNTLEFDINGTQALDVPGMVAFADEVNALLEKSTLLLSSKDGIFTPGPASSRPFPFLETYSWLDDSPGLYAAGDGLAERLQKYSDYAILNRERGFHAEDRAT